MVGLPLPGRRRGRRILIFGRASAGSLALLLLALVPGGLRPQEPPSPPAGPDTEALPAALDSLARQAMDGGRIPGLAVVLVRDGGVALSRGYGTVSPGSGTPVSADSTRFSFGSMSKLVTAVAAMQLREAGRLSFDVDVRTYLPDQVVPPGPGGPVTLHDILTHTSGLEATSVGVAARSPADLGGLRAYLARRPSRRVRPPGRLYVYSQVGYGMVGLAVAESSGTPFPEYVDRRVFGPLGMASASFEPGALDDPRTAPGFHWTGDGFRPAPTAYHRVPPAGGLVSTPRDLGRLLEALLEGAAGRGTRVLPARAARDLLRRQWSPHPDPRVEGTAYGLFEYRACGLRGLTSRGWVGGHSSYLHLMPGAGAALVVAGNAASLQGLQVAMREAMHRRLSRRPGCLREGEDGGEPGDGDGGDVGTPATPDPAAQGTGDGGGEEAAGAPDPAAPGAAARDTASPARAAPAGPPHDTAPGTPRGPDGEGAGGATSRLAGTYRMLGFASRGVESLGRLLLSPAVGVEATDEGLAMDFGGSTVQVARVDPRLYRASWRPGRDQHFAFLPGGAEGRAGRYLMWGGIAYERVPWFLTPGFARGSAAALALVFLAGVAAPGVGALRGWWRRRRGDGGESPEGTGAAAARHARWACAAVSALALAFAAGMAAHLGDPARYQFAFGVPPTVRGLLWLPALAGAGAVALAAATVRAWRRQAGGLARRALWSAVAVAGLATAAVAAGTGLLPL